MNRHNVTAVIIGVLLCTTLYTNCEMGGQLELPSCTVVYEANGGSGKMTNSIHTYGTAKNLNTNLFTRTGYTFTGWSESPTGSIKYTNRQNVDKLAEESGTTIYLYAQWNAHSYTIVYNSNGGNGTMQSTPMKYDTAQTLRANTFTNGTTSFTGWAVSAGGAVVYADKSSVQNLSALDGDTVSLYAKWNKNPSDTYTVTFNADSGSPAPSAQTIVSGGKVTEPATMIRSGYIFVGWYKENTFVNQWNFITDTVTDSITLYAKWNYIPVTDITDVPNEMTLGSPLTLTSTVVPETATNQTIKWTIKDAGSTGASISDGNILNATAAGSVIVTATIINSVDSTVNFSSDFTIMVRITGIFSLTFNAENAPTLTGPVIHRSSVNGLTTATLTIDNPEQYSSIDWYINERGITGSGETFTLDSANVFYNAVGEYFITVEVTKGSIPYNRTVSFWVAE